MLSDIKYFTGSENFYKHWLGIIFTDGVKYVAEEAGAYWLIDAIASYYKETKQHEFQAWTLKKKANGEWNLRATDGNDNVIANQEIEFSDFPIDEIQLFLCDNTLMLTSEY